MRHRLRRPGRPARNWAIPAFAGLLGLLPVSAVAAEALPDPFVVDAPDAQVQIEVDLQLVIATDVSGSIDSGEAFLQRKGVADAFRSSEVIQAIRAGSLGRIAIAYVDFSSRYYNQVLVDWYLVDDQESSLELANTLMRIPRTRGQGTSISDAIEFSMALFEYSPYYSADRVIDISGDGPNRSGRPLKEVRDEAVSKGFIINGLPIVNRYGFDQMRNLDDYFVGCVIGGRGAFIQVAEGFADFSRAIRRKLVLELSDLAPELVPRNAPPLVRVADAPLPQLPQMTAPQPRYTGPCDEWGFYR